MNHKHKGVLTSKGYPRPHPVSRVHTDLYAKRCHTLEINSSKKKTATKPKSKAVKSKSKVAKPKTRSFIQKTKEVFTKSSLPLDSDGYLRVDMTKDFRHKGVRVQFKRTQNRKRRTVGLQIEA